MPIPFSKPWKAFRGPVETPKRMDKEHWMMAIQTLRKYDSPWWDASMDHSLMDRPTEVKIVEIDNTPATDMYGQLYD